MSSTITAEELRTVLDYNRDTGLFTWRVCPSRKFRVGDVAGSSHSNGYVHIMVRGRRYFAHRLAILHETGSWPAEQVDHINGVRDDNRICNLRCVTASVNLQNQRKARSDSRSGLLGVSWSQGNGKWAAFIRADGANRYVGYFDTPEAAHAAYVAAKRLLHPGNTL